MITVLARGHFSVIGLDSSFANFAICDQMSSRVNTEEIEVECPFCGETFSIVVDTSIESQQYVEDCYVCCRPILFRVNCAENEEPQVNAERS